MNGVFPIFDDKHLPPFDESISPDLVVFSKLINDVCGTLLLPLQLEGRPFAGDGGFRLLQPLLVGPILLGEHLRQIASPWVVLGVDCEVFDELCG